MAGDDSPARRGKPTPRDVLALCALVAVGCIVWECNVVYSGEMFSLVNFDLYSEFYPRHSFAAAVLRTGHLPLWDPHQIAGLPFLATYQGGILYPPNLLYAALPTDLAMGVLGLLHVIAAGAFTYVLCREFGRSRTASWLAGLTFMVGGSTLFMSFHTNAINSVPWLPAALYCTARLARDADLRWALLLGLSIALQFLAGRDFTFVMTVHSVCLFAAFQLVWMLRGGRNLRRAGRHVAQLAIGAALAAGLVAAQALPTLALAAASGRTTAGLEGKFLEVYDPMSPAFFLANLVNPAAGAIRREYFGWIPLVCFLLGFRLWGRDRPAVFASLLSLLAFVLCFGSQTPLYAAYRGLPLGAAFRLPDRFVYLFSFGFALVAASGLDRLIEVRGDLRARVRPLAPRFIALLALGLALFFALDSRWLEAGLESAAKGWSWFASYGFERDHFAAIDRAIAYFAAATALLAAFAWRVHARGGRALQVAVLLFAAADLGFAQRNAFLHPAHDSSPAQAGASCYAEVPAIAGPLGRHLSFRLPGIHALKDKDGELFSRYSATHYDPLVTQRQAAYFAALEEGSRPFWQTPWTERSLFMGFLSGTPAPDRVKLLDLLGTRAILVDGRREVRPPALDAFLGRFRRVSRCRVVTDDGAIPIDLYANPNALPRAFVVHRVTGVDSGEEALRHLVAPGFDPRREAVVEGTPPSLALGGRDGVGRVEIPVYSANRVVVQVETPEPGLLVLTDSYDPEWRVTRNGQASQIYPTDALFRGVPVPAGESELIFRYEPRQFQRGVAISVVTGVLGALLWFRARSRRAGA
jgi:hypothetical protein